MRASIAAWPSRLFASNNTVAVKKRPAQGSCAGLVGLAAELLNEFVNLTETGRAYRVSLRFETARRIDRDSAAQGRYSAFGEPPP